MSRVVHFEISADDPERAMQFYSNIFGWQFSKWDGPIDYWMAETGPEDQPGINGAVMRRSGPISYVNTIDVQSVDDVAERVIAGGGQIVEPRMTVPGIGYMIYFQDPEGNVFGAMETDPNAA